ncbi:MAG: carboxypeptidase-like regulatory domain-containing protein [Candidatus Thermoplasmatota archaeon]
MKVVLVVLLVASLALAGCNDGKKGGTGGGTTQPPLAAGKGAIAGLVVDDVYRPVPDALVLASNGFTATTDPSGQFTLVDLDPGAYILRVQADGYEAAPQSFEVVAGEYTEAEVLTRRIVNEGSRIITTEYNVFVSCNVNAVVIGLPYDCTFDQSGDSDRPGFIANYTGIQNITYMVTEMKANKVGNYEVRIRPEDHDQGPDGNYAVMEIVDSDYMRIVHKIGEVAHDPFELTGGNVAWNNTEPFLTVLYVDSIGKDAGGTGTFGVGVDVGVRAKFVQSIFVGEPPVNIDSYGVLD